MRIIVSFDPDTYFSTEDNSLLRLLGLEPVEMLDQALSRLRIYTEAPADVAFERTVDDVFAHIESRFGDTKAGQTAQHILAEHSDRLAELLTTLAYHLKHFLPDLRGCPPHVPLGDSEEIPTAWVEAFNRIGKYVVIAIGPRP